MHAAGPGHGQAAVAAPGDDDDRGPGRPAARRLGSGRRRDRARPRSSSLALTTCAAATNRSTRRTASSCGPARAGPHVRVEAEQRSRPRRAGARPGASTTSAPATRRSPASRCGRPASGPAAWPARPASSPSRRCPGRRSRTTRGRPRRARRTPASSGRRSRCRPDRSRSLRCGMLAHDAAETAASTSARAARWGARAAAGPIAMLNGPPPGRATYVVPGSGCTMSSRASPSTANIADLLCLSRGRRASRSHVCDGRGATRSERTTVSRVRDITYPPIIVTAKAAFKVSGLKFQISGSEHVPRTGGAVLARQPHQLRRLHLRRLRDPAGQAARALHGQARAVRPQGHRPADALAAPHRGRPRPTA